MAGEGTTATTEQAQQTTQATTEGTKTAESTQQSTTTGASTQAAAPGDKGSVAEDPRIKGLIADLQKERRARQDFESRYTRSTAELEAERKRVQALAGVTPKDPAEAEVEQIRQQFSKLFPGLAKLTDEQIEKLLGVAENADQLKSTINFSYERHSATMLEALETRVASELGGELSERQKRRLAAAYVEEAERNPEFLARHDKGDQKLIEEFAKEYLEDWFKPAQRKLTASQVGRTNRPIPRSGSAQPLTTQGVTKPAKDTDELTDRAVAYLREHGQMGQ